MASSFGGGSPIASPHRDVLEATPETDESKGRLVEEIKSRAKGAVSTKNWMEASLLYEKAISLTPSEAALHSNLSLVKFSMGDFKDARTSAQAAVDADPKYVKAYWRLGQAMTKLGDYEAALKTNQKALVLDPTNKALKKEIEKLKIKVVEDKARKEQEAKEKEAADAAEAEAMLIDPPDLSAPPPPKTATAPTTTKPKEETPVTTTDDAVFSKSDHVKGYKIVNGKKTSFFHNELTEEAKQLIGDIAPKRLDTTTTTTAAAATPTSGSAWNKAGTWEEKNVTNWAKESLQKSLLTVSYTLPSSSPAPGAVVQLTKIPTCDGHASFAMVRGKKRYIYEFCLTLEWQFTVEDDVASGQMSFPDFDGTCELGEGYDMVQWEVKESTSATLTPLLDRFVKNGGLRDAIHESLDDWVRLFRETY